MPTRPPLVPSAPIVLRTKWAAPSRRSRLIAAALAVVMAALTAVLADVVWKRPGHPPAAHGPVQVRLIPTPASPPGPPR